jgi:hydroxypyruvate isomerase
VTGLRYSANLSMLWPDRDPYERFDAAAAAGFGVVEMLFPQHLDVTEVEARLAANGLTMVLFDLNAGDWAAGERGIAALPDRVDELHRHALDDLDLAARLGTRVVTVLAGRRAPGTDPAECDRVLVDNLRRLADPAAERGLVLTVEAINGTDVPGFHVTSIAHAAAIVDAVGHEAVGLQFDQYHVVMEGDDPLALLGEHLARIRHVQIADAPGRHEPGTGTAPVREFLARLDEHGYAGAVGLEYVPEGDTDEGLVWLPRELRGA